MSIYFLLNSELNIRGMTVKNRVAMMPMGTNFGSAYGEINEDHIRYYEERAKGGTGLIIVENAAVDQQGLNGTTQLRIDKDCYIPALGRLTDKLHAYGCCAALQINHAGACAMSSRTGEDVVSASDIPFSEGGIKPRPMTKEEINSVVRDYGMAAKRAVIAGFDMVEIHIGHAYLLHQFVSPYFNKRTDEFGGSPENRARFPKMVLEEVRKAVGPKVPIGVRISADDLYEGGNTLEDTLDVVSYFDEYVDIYNVSVGIKQSNNYQLDTMNLPDGWKRKYSKAVKERFGKPAIAVGNIRNPEVAEDILRAGDADMIGIGRGLIADPQWTNKALSGREREIRKCISCNTGCAGNRMANNRAIKCTVNPDVIFDEEYKQEKIKKQCNVVIVGGGPAGLEAACTAAEVGCTVFLFEKNNEIGGALRTLSKLPAKARIGDFAEYFDDRISRLNNLFVFTGKEPTTAEISCLKPNLIINATGSQAVSLPIPGLAELLDKDDTHLYTSAKILKQVPELEKTVKNKRAVIIGGGLVGMDIMEFFAKSGAERVTVVEMAEQIAADADPISKTKIAEIISKYGVDILTGWKLVKVEKDAVFCEKNNEAKQIEYDVGAICVGIAANKRSHAALSVYCQENEILYQNIGDSKRAGKIITAVEEGRGVLKTLKQFGYL